MTIENRSDLGRLKTLSIWGMYVLTPKTAQRRGLYCKPTPPVRLTTSSRGDRVLTHPPPWGIGRARYRIAFCIFIHRICIACLYNYTAPGHILFFKFQRRFNGVLRYAVVRQRLNECRRADGRELPALLQGHTRRMQCPLAVPTDSSLITIRCACDCV